MTQLLALPMHGEGKLRREGLRTRDGHVLEWISRLRPDIEITVLSRPEPWPRVSADRIHARRAGRELCYPWRFVSPQKLVAPPLRDRQRWWPRSQRYFPPWPHADVVLAWNPFVHERAATRPTSTPLLFDLLDDWTIHDTFRPIRAELEGAYTAMFETADVITANSEGTLALAHRFGRDDAMLVLNGVDPDRFALEPIPRPGVTVGYGGKIGHRLDVALIQDVAGRFPSWTFEFAGPVLIPETGRQLAAIPNVRLLGDFHYDDYPEALRNWTVAWVPHRTGDGEVGGDVIKPYEYRAAGLLVASTRVIGWERALDGVRIADGLQIADVLDDLVRDTVGAHGVRRLHRTPETDTWRHKTGQMLDLVLNRREDSA